jgi:hypothetical protein
VTPTLDILKTIHDDLNSSSGDPKLKGMAFAALERTANHIDTAFNNVLSHQLGKCLHDIHVFRTTETNITSPVANIMKPHYEATLRFGSDAASEGKFAAMSGHLTCSTTIPSTPPSRQPENPTKIDENCTCISQQQQYNKL